ncbi:MAG TPA: efflux RND transporter periplasmic adaptor subunit [Polyangiaceae bacterium]|jgi:RND family efflux transporter MFP subunit
MLRPRKSLLFTALVVCSSPACKQSEAAPTSAAKDEAPIHVSTAPATQQPMPEFLTLTGSLLADKQSDIAADANGKVLTTNVERGQAVKQGELLATLDARAAALSATAALAQEQLAKTQADQAKTECDRAKQLYDSGAISKAEYDRTMSQCSGTQWSVAAAAAQHGSAAKMVGDSVIRAPFSGVVGERYVNVGQYVQPSTRVVSLYAIDPLRLELSVPEANIALIKPDLAVDFQVAAYGEQTFSGKVRFISPNVRESSRDLVVDAVVPNADGKLRPGMFATVRLQIGMKPAVVAPLPAVRKDLDPPRAYAVVDGRVEERVLQLGEEQNGVIAIVSGIKAGESLVLNPPPTIHDGARVE